MNEEKLKKWLRSYVIGANNYGTEWKADMQKDLDEIFDEDLQKINKTRVKK